MQKIKSLTDKINSYFFLESARFNPWQFLLVWRVIINYQYLNLSHDFGSHGDLTAIRYYRYVLTQSSRILARCELRLWQVVVQLDATVRRGGGADCVKGRTFKNRLNVLPIWSFGLEVDPSTDHRFGCSPTDRLLTLPDCHFSATVFRRVMRLKACPRCSWYAFHLRLCSLVPPSLNKTKTVHLSPTALNSYISYTLPIFSCLISTEFRTLTSKFLHTVFNWLPGNLLMSPSRSSVNPPGTR